MSDIVAVVVAAVFPAVVLAGAFVTTAWTAAAAERSRTLRRDGAACEIVRSTWLARRLHVDLVRLAGALRRGQPFPR
ncbi:MAG TPA: hypothetical protein VGI84_11055 [Pseudonocardiaceae bacterium]|jgi:hypothetical protein